MIKRLSVLVMVSVMYVSQVFGQGFLTLRVGKLWLFTENAYPPLQFIDPNSGDAIGWEYDAMEEIASLLNASITYENISWDAMIAAVSEGQFD